MTIAKQFIHAVVAGALALGVSTAALADKQGRNTIIGAGLGGAAGALISDGDPWVILGGAAAGGVLGHVITDDDRGKRQRHWDRRPGWDHHKKMSYRGHDKHRGGKHKHKKYRHH